jgi:N-acetylglucosamine kinase-like BadF-type ATPase
MALLTLRETGGQVDVAAVTEALQDVQFAVDNVRKMKARLTTIGSAAQEVSSLLDELRERVLASVRDIDDLVRAADASSAAEPIPLSA